MYICERKKHPISVSLSLLCTINNTFTKHFVVFFSCGAFRCLLSKSINIVIQIFGKFSTNGTNRSFRCVNYVKRILFITFEFVFPLNIVRPPPLMADNEIACNLYKLNDAYTLVRTPFIANMHCMCC